MYDYGDKKGAQLLADTIMNFWKEKGKSAKVWIEPLNPSKPNWFDKNFIIKSNLRNGLPPE